MESCIECGRGSSPHARGTQTRPLFHSPAPRIIPACAGNTPTWTCPTGSPWDHPRMRGEHPNTKPTRANHTGSSPHARGTRIRVCRWLYRPGIIPACAGNTIPLSPQATSTRDHPRMRGKHLMAEVLRPGEEGSSPHARGTLGCRRAKRGNMGIIPACAGNTVRDPVRQGSVRDHPRMRGEHLNDSLTPSNEVGSSPHARGTPRRPSRIR